MVQYCLNECNLYKIFKLEDEVRARVLYLSPSRWSSPSMLVDRNSPLYHADKFSLQHGTREFTELENFHIWVFNDDDGWLKVGSIEKFLFHEDPIGAVFICPQTHCRIFRAWAKGKTIAVDSYGMVSRYKSSPSHRQYVPFNFTLPVDKYEILDEVESFSVLLTGIESEREFREILFRNKKYNPQKVRANGYTPLEDGGKDSGEV